MKHSFGIDLGTTNSCIAVKTVGEPAKTITLADGRKTLPSCVMYKDGQVIVGYEAYKCRYDTDHVIYSSKRDIGSDKTYTVYANGDDKPAIEVSPVDVAAEILKKLKHDAELLFGEGYVQKVTITVPAYFTLERRAATIQAAEEAGLEVVALINEPTSAAIAYTEGKSDNEDILIYDLGGGTFDVTLLGMLKPDNTLSDLFGESVMSDTMAKVLTSSGDPMLGGDDLDKRVFDLAVGELAKELGVDDISQYMTPESAEQAILLIETNKKRDTIAGMSIPVYIQLPGEESATTRTLTINGEMYQQAFEEIYERTRAIVSDCLSGRKQSSISKLILIGGSTKLPMLRERVTKDYNIPVYVELNPDEAVALGAATYTSILAGETNMTVSDILPQSIGIECISAFGEQMVEGRMNKLIPKNTPLPSSASTVLTTTEPNQTRAVIPVYQGEDPIAENNIHIGTVVMDIKPSSEKRAVKVTLTIDASGVLKVKLNSNTESATVVLQNVLRPATATVSKRDKLIKRYEIIIRRYAVGTEERSKGTEAIEDFRAGKITFSELKKTFDALTLADREKMSAAIQENVAASSYAPYTHIFNEESSDEDSGDE